MGMFDTVVVEGLKLKSTATVDKFLKANNAELPNDFQTKDLVNALRTYKIDSNKQVWCQVPKETGKRIPYKPLFAGWTDNRSFIERLILNSKLKGVKTPKTSPEIKYVWVKEKITNTFEMYTYTEIGGRYLDVSYEVRVIDGIVKNIELKDSKIEPEAEAKARHARNHEWEENMKINFDRRNKFVSKWYYPIIKETYNPLVFLFRLALQKLANALTRWSYRLHGV